MEGSEGKGRAGLRQRASQRTPGELVSSVLAMLLGVAVASAFLSVNIFPVFTNDSVLYLDHSMDIPEGGWVEYGYRQVGYPLALAAIRVVGNALGAGPLLSVAILQRVLLAVAAYLAWRFWRWWSLPVLAFLVAGETLAYTNFLLTEGLALPLAALLVFPSIRFFELLQREATVDRRRSALALGVLIVALVSCLYSLRFTYAAFGAVPLALAVASWRTAYRRTALAMLVVTVTFIGSFALLTSIENQTEHGVFTPSAGGGSVRYYYAWQQVFAIHPENRGDPSLSEYYDVGFVHDFSREVGAMGLSPEEETATYEAEIEAMLEAAGLSATWSKMESSFFALIGGRLHDTGPAVGEILSSDVLDADGTIYMNQFAEREGPQAFVDEYNDGQLAEVVITDSVGWHAPVPSTRLLVAILLPIGMALMFAGLVFRRTRTLSAAGLVVVMTSALGLGWITADNFRFLLPTSAFGIMMATGVLVQLIRGPLASRFGITADRSKAEDIRDVP